MAPIVVLSHSAMVLAAALVMLPSAARGQSADSLRTDSLSRLLANPPSVVVNHQVDGAPVRGTKAANPIEAIAARIPGARVRYPGTERGNAPILELRHRILAGAVARPLFTYDGIRLLSDVSDLPTSAFTRIDVTPGLGGTVEHGAGAAGGLVQLISALPDSSRTRVTAHTEVGSSWLPPLFPISTHHHFLLGPDGGYVDANGNPVSAAERIPEPDGVTDNPYPGPLYDHHDALFEPTWRSSVDVSVGRRHSSGWVSVGAGHTRRGIAMREGTPLTRAHARLSIGQRVHRAVDLTATAMRIDGEVPDVTAARTYVVAATSLRPDIDLHAREPDGAYVSPIATDFGTYTNPLGISHANAARGRTIAGVRARGEVLDWLAVQGGWSLDAIDEKLIHQGVRTDLSGTSTEWWRTADERRSRLWTLDLGFTASTRRWRIDWAADLAASVGGAEGDGRSEMASGPIEMTTTPSSMSWSAWSIDQKLGRISLTIDGRHDAGVAFLGNLRRERTPWGGEHDYRIDHLLGLSYDLARPWTSAPAWLDRAELRVSTGTSWRELPVEPSRYFAPASLPTVPERERETEVSLSVLMSDRYALSLAYAGGTTENFLGETFTPFGRSLQNIGTAERHSIEARLSADLVRRPDVDWSLGMTLDRGRQRIVSMQVPPHYSSFFWVQKGAVYGQIHGAEWVRSHEQLPDVHAGSHSAFVVNDDGLLVPVGLGGSLDDPAFGTIVTIDGQSYAWGLPLEQSDGLAHLIGDRNPEVAFGIASSLRWRALTLAAVASGQLGGDVYDHLRQAGYRRRTHVDVDQSAKAPELRKPVEYYERLYGPFASDWFVEDATHLRLRELAVSFAPRLARGLTVSVIGRNLATWTSYAGLDVEALFLATIADADTRSQDYRLPPARAVSIQLGYGF